MANTIIGQCPHCQGDGDASMHFVCNGRIHCPIENVGHENINPESINFLPDNFQPEPMDVDKNGPTGLYDGANIVGIFSALLSNNGKKIDLSSIGDDIFYRDLAKDVRNWIFEKSSGTSDIVIVCTDRQMVFPRREMVPLGITNMYLSDFLNMVWEIDRGTYQEISVRVIDNPEAKDHDDLLLRLLHQQIPDSIIISGDKFDDSTSSKTSFRLSHIATRELGSMERSYHVCNGNVPATPDHRHRAIANRKDISEVARRFWGPYGYIH